MAGAVLEASCAADVAAMLRDAASASRALLVRGSGTKLAWRGDGRSGAAILSTRGLTGAPGHDAGDLVASIPAGLTLADANRALAAAGQWLPLDPPDGDRATIGGIVSTNDSGPRRLRYGAPRDLIIGVEAALSTGEVIHAGGRVVKNVAGYDLSRLMCGAFGTLGVITRATFKLAPLPQSSLTIRLLAPSMRAALEASATLAATSLTPSAVEVIGPEPQLLVRFESTPRATDQMSVAAENALRPYASHLERLSDEAERHLWTTCNQLLSDVCSSRVTISVLPATLPALLDGIAVAAARFDSPWRLVGRATLGVLDLSVSGTSAAQMSMIAAIETLVRAGGGHVTMRAPAKDVVPPVPVFEPGPRALMLAIARQFDPANVLGGAERFGSRIA